MCQAAVSVRRVAEAASGVQAAAGAARGSKGGRAGAEGGCQSNCCLLRTVAVHAAVGAGPRSSRADCWGSLNPTAHWLSTDWLSTDSLKVQQAHVSAVRHLSGVGSMTSRSGSNMFSRAAMHSVTPSYPNISCAACRHKAGGRSGQYTCQGQEGGAAAAAALPERRCALSCSKQEQ